MIRPNSEQIIFANESFTPYLENNSVLNAIYYSELKGIHSKKVFRNFSIKCALEGTEYYNVNGTEFKVDPGMALIAGKNPDGEVYFDSKYDVKSLCIDISETTISQAVYLLRDKSNFDFDVSQEYFEPPLFFDRVGHLAFSSFQSEIKNVVTLISLYGVDAFRPNDEWYLNLAEKIVEQESGFIDSLRGLKPLRSSTKKELLKRLLVGKEYIDQNFLRNPRIHEVAKYCALSEFHFYRCFKQAFKISPYQYTMEKRLNYACGLLSKEKTSLTEIAMICGFPDFFTFSKAFKRQLKLSPSHYKLTI